MNKFIHPFALTFIAALGPIAPYFEDKTITDICVNDDGKLWVKRNQQGFTYENIILEEQARRKIIEMVAGFAKTTANRSNPRISAELPFFKYRFEGNLPGMVIGPTIIIRKPSTVLYTLDDYVNQGIINSKQKEVIQTSIHRGIDGTDPKNILIVGGTGSGKTTFANAILNEFKESQERFYILEDTRELQCAAANKVYLTTCDEIDMNGLLFSAMRGAPDRIIVGEVRDKAALELLKAWNTGHPGGLSTIHANSCKSSLLRLEQLVLEGIPNPQATMIAEAVDLIIFIKVVNGTRKVTEMAYLKGYIDNDYKLEYIS